MSASMIEGCGPWRTPAELIAHYKAVNQRITKRGEDFERRQRMEREADLRLQAEREAARRETARLMKREQEESAAVTQLVHLPRHARRIIQRVAVERGVSALDIVGPSRAKAAVEARWQAIRELKRERPTYSTTRIGQIFGRDHSSIVHALKKGECYV